MSDNNSEIVNYLKLVPSSVEGLKNKGGGGTFDGMEPRVAKIEARLDSIDKSLERIESGLLTKWDMAQVVFFVVGGLMAAAIFGPRIASMLPATP